MTSPTRLARTIGALYLSLVVLGPIAYLVSKEGYDVGDPVGTVAWIAGNELLVRVGLFAEFGIIAVEVVLAGLLFWLMRPASREWSLVAALARFAMVAVQAVLLAVGLALVANPTAADTLLPLLSAGEVTWGAIFGVHLAVLGVLIIRSGFLPKWLGWAIEVAAGVYLAQGVGTLLVPSSAEVLDTIVLASIPGELALTFWLLVKGVDDDAWRRAEAR